MAILVTGGGGMTSRAMAIQLKAAGIPFVVGSTRGADASAPGITAVKFDWTDTSTFPFPFQHEFPNNEEIKAVYIVSGSLADPGGRRCRVSGAVTHSLIERWSVEADAEQTVTWRGSYRPSRTRARSTRAPGMQLWLSSARRISRRLLSKASHDQLTEKFSRILGRDVEHVKLSEEQRVAKMMDIGFPAEASTFAAYMEANVWDKEWDDTTARVTGKKLVTCDEFIERHKEGNPRKTTN